MHHSSIEARVLVSDIELFNNPRASRVQRRKAGERALRLAAALIALGC